jgi:hypothetical protein
MPAKAGIQQGFPDTLDSRLRGNDNQAGKRAALRAAAEGHFLAQ